MIHCDHRDCKAPTSYKDGKPATFGTEPEWAIFIVNGFAYCGWHVDLYDPNNTKRRHTTSITDIQEWKSHENRQALAKGK